MLEPTPCETCDNVHMDTRKKHPGQWMCVKFPRLENMDAIAPTKWILHEPYNRCVNINRGHCPLWTVRRDGQLELGSKSKDVIETKGK